MGENKVPCEELGARVHPSRRSMLILKRQASRVETASPMNPSPRMSGGRAEVEPLHGGAITKVWKSGSEEELLIEMGTAAAQVSADQIRIHLFQICWGVDGPRPDQVAETRG